MKNLHCQLLIFLASLQHTAHLVKKHHMRTAGAQLSINVVFIVISRFHDAFYLVPDLVPNLVPHRVPNFVPDFFFKTTFSKKLFKIMHQTHSGGGSGGGGGGQGWQVAPPQKDVRGQTCLFATPSEACG